MFHDGLCRSNSAHLPPLAIKEVPPTSPNLPPEVTGFTHATSSPIAPNTAPDALRAYCRYRASAAYSSVCSA